MKALMDPCDESRLRSFLASAIEARRPALSARELAGRCEQCGYKVNESYITQFLNGTRRSLSFRALRSVGRVLGVSYIYLLEMAGYLEEEELAQLGEADPSLPLDSAVLEVLRLTGLSPLAAYLVREHYDFIRMADRTAVGKELIRASGDFVHALNLAPASSTSRSVVEDRVAPDRDVAA